MSDIFYSIEWLPNNGPKDPATGKVFNCWNQYVLTSNKWAMRFYKWECTKLHGKTSKIRVREL